MKKILLLSAILILTLGSAHAQLSSTIATQKHDLDFSSGRDFWLALPSNQWGDVQTGTYINMYLTSPGNTTAYIELGATRDSVGIAAYQVSTFTIPEAMEMESSGEVENKGIHVYSKDADLTVYFLSRQPASSDGSYIIPTIGWGKDYVVAAYGSLYDGPGSDLPSECTIVADENNTTVAITPSCGCRLEEIINGVWDTLIIPAGTLQTFEMNRGQSLQLMAAKATAQNGFDMTGTIIHANNPIGVIGASMEPNIPDDFDYGDFVCSMIPPVRTWGETYYSTAFEQAPSVNDHDYACYLFIASQPNQVIFGHDCTQDDYTECTIGSQYGIYWDFVAGAQKFFSNAPFLECEYIPSATYPDGSNGLGDPAMSTVMPREQFVKTLIIEGPDNPTTQTPIDPYYNYTNLIVNVKDANKTLYDGQRVSNHPSQCIDGNWEAIPLTDVPSGAHLITGDDSGIGVYWYGYGYDESYAWSSASFVGTLNSPDTIPPHADTIGHCYGEFVHVSDSGLLPDGVDAQSGLAEIVLDSDYNMTFVPDADFIPGSGVDTSGYSMSVTDITKPAILVVKVYDLAGNETTVTSSYKSNYATIEPPLQNLGVWNAADPPPFAFDTIYNLGQTPFDIGELQLKYGNVGFSIFDSIGGPLDLSPLQPGQRRLIRIRFQDPNSQFQVDSILFGNDCESQSVAVIGSGGVNDFAVTNQSWLNEPLPAPIAGYQKLVELENLSQMSITIDSASWPDAHFRAVSSFPVTLPASPGMVSFVIAYLPDTAMEYDETQGSWYSHNVLASDGITPSPRFDSLTGSAPLPSSVSEGNSPSTEATILPTNDGRSIAIILPSDITAPANFEVVNVLGQSVLGANFTTQNETIDASSLPRGVYFYRLSLGTSNQMGKLILGQ